MKNEIFLWEAKGLEPRLDVGKVARRAARKNAPKAGATKKIGDKRRKSPKHKKPLRDEMGG